MVIGGKNRPRKSGLGSSNSSTTGDPSLSFPPFEPNTTFISDFTSTTEDLSSTASPTVSPTTASPTTASATASPTTASPTTVALTTSSPTKQSSSTLIVPTASPTTPSVDEDFFRSQTTKNFFTLFKKAF